MILDLDDTLFDHLTSARHGIARLIDELGAKADEEILDAWELSAEQQALRRRNGEIDRDGYRRERIRTLLHSLGRPAEAVRLHDEEADRLYARFVALYESAWVAFDDAIPLLEELGRRGVMTAILTNGPEERQQAKASRLGLRPWVTRVWTSERLATRKPEARAYLSVCEALRVPPAKVLHIGDDMDNDVIGARAAGLLALHVDRRQALDPAPWRIHGLMDAFEHL